MAFARVGFEVEASVSFPAPAASCKTLGVIKKTDVIKQNQINESERN